MRAREARSVGVRELKASLSAYLRRVRRGESLVITDRGRAVARIFPVGMPEGIARLIADGQVTWSGRKPDLSGPTVRLRGPGPSLSDIVIQDREEHARFLDSLIAKRARRPRRISRGPMRSGERRD